MQCWPIAAAVTRPVAVAAARLAGKPHRMRADLNSAAGARRHPTRAAIPLDQNGAAVPFAFAGRVPAFPALRLRIHLRDILQL